MTVLLSNGILADFLGTVPSPIFEFVWIEHGQRRPPVSFDGRDQRAFFFEPVDENGSQLRSQSVDYSTYFAQYASRLTLLAALMDAHFDQPVSIETL